MAISKSILALAAVICCLAVLPTEGRRHHHVMKTNVYYDHHTKYYPKYVMRYVPVPSPYYVPFPIKVGGSDGGQKNDKIIVVSGHNSGSHESHDHHGYSA